VWRASYRAGLVRGSLSLSLSPYVCVSLSSPLPLCVYLRVAG